MANPVDGSSQVLLFLNKSLTLPVTRGNQTGLASAAQGWCLFHAWCFAARLWAKFHANESFFGTSVQRLDDTNFPMPTESVHHGSNIVARHPCSEDCSTHESNAVPWLGYQKTSKNLGRYTESNSCWMLGSGANMMLFGGATPKASRKDSSHQQITRWNQVLGVATANLWPPPSLERHFVWEALVRVLLGWDRKYRTCHLTAMRLQSKSHLQMICRRLLLTPQRFVLT